MTAKELAQSQLAHMRSIREAAVCEAARLRRAGLRDRLDRMKRHVKDLEDRIALLESSSKR